MERAWRIGLLTIVLPLGAADFARDVQPIFVKRCQGCHGAAQQMGGVRLDDGTAARKGGYSGAILVPGSAASSKLYQRITAEKKEMRMPPGGQLEAAEIAAIGKWIEEGAVWPAGATSSGKKAVSLWSLQPIRRPALPEMTAAGWGKNPIDRFVLARLEREKIAPSKEAGKMTLLRRVTFDLTGLPPKPAEVDAFLADTRADAYERLVDRLLTSPHYGEKWARQWLDLARYADSDGYEKDLSRPHAWRYRQWVIEALNRDLPFDAFTKEQLAGDLLPGSTVEQRVATGFQRNTLTNREAGVDRAEARFEQLINRTGTVGTVWLGLTIGCAQCHDHKYDPISQRDFYQMFAFFDRAMEEDIEAPLPGEREKYDPARGEYWKKRTAMLEAAGVPKLQEHWEAKLNEARANPGKDLEWDFWVTSMRAMMDHADRVLKIDPGKRTARQQERLTDYFLSTLGPEYNQDKELRERLKKLREELKKMADALPPFAEAQVLVEDPEAAPSHMRLKGDYKSLGVEVEPGVLGALPPMAAGAPKNRLGLAEWLVSRENPLVARVTVNRAWQELFGKGLVRTSEDFGSQGEKPTHPELLDWLASEFMDQGWSLKKLHRLIVTSATYRQSSAAREELRERDPDNTLLARQTRMRLPAESIRDAALEASGLLNAEIGGKSVRPPLPKGLTELSYGSGMKWVETEGREKYRRGLYVHFQRTVPYPQLMTFDAPDSNTSCSRRRTSNTPLQSLNLLNDPVFFEAAQALAGRVLREKPGAAFGERLDYAFALCLARKPQEKEKARLGRYFDQQVGILRNEVGNAGTLMAKPPGGVDAVEGAAWVGLSRVMLNLDEFITRE